MDRLKGRGTYSRVNWADGKDKFSDLIQASN